MPGRMARRPNRAQAAETIAIFEQARGFGEFVAPRVFFIERFVRGQPVAGEPGIGRAIDTDGIRE